MSYLEYRGIAKDGGNMVPATHAALLKYILSTFSQIKIRQCSLESKAVDISYLKGTIYFWGTLVIFK